MAALTNYLENRLVDWLLRGQAFAPPAAVYCALMTAAPSDAAGGMEVAGGDYARVAVASGLASWAGTQGAGTTVASSGASGTTSNNDVVAFPTPSAAWGTVTHLAVFDAAVGGNMLWWTALDAPRAISAGDGVRFPAGSLTLQLDN